MKQVGWVDEFGNLFPIQARTPSARTYVDWRPVYDISPGEIAYQLTKRMVIDITTARAAVDAALLNCEKVP